MARTRPKGRWGLGRDPAGRPAVRDFRRQQSVLARLKDLLDGGGQVVVGVALVVAHAHDPQA